MTGDLKGWPYWITIRQKNGYSGWYYKNSSISIKADPKHSQMLSHWLVNGRRINGMILKYIVNQDTDIKAVFKMKSE